METLFRFHVLFFVVFLFCWSLSRLSEDDVFTFGLGQFGQLGHGTFIFESRLPRPVEHFKRGRVCQVACGENHTAVITGECCLYFAAISNFFDFLIESQSFHCFDEGSSDLLSCCCSDCCRWRLAVHVWRRQTWETGPGRRELHQPV